MGKSKVGYVFTVTPDTYIFSVHLADDGALQT